MFLLSKLIAIFSLFCPLVCSFAISDQELKNQLQKQKDAYMNMNASTMHALPEINDYWAEKYLTRWFHNVFSPGDTWKSKDSSAKLLRTSSERIYFEVSKRWGKKKDINIVSIGSGACSDEISLMKIFQRSGVNAKLTAVELNEGQMDFCKTSAMKENLASNFIFQSVPASQFISHSSRYEVVIILWAAHHMLELEAIFNSTEHIMSSDGFLYIEEMIGNNGHRRWPGAKMFFDKFWPIIPDRFKFSRHFMEFQIKYREVDYANEGFEGVRSKDIFPLLMERFHFERFIVFGSLTDYFRDREYGYNLNVGNQYDLDFIDFLQYLEDILLKAGYLNPTHMFAVLSLPGKQKSKTFHRPGLSPKHCMMAIESRKIIQLND